MLRERKIAFFIDVDNLGLDYEHYEGLMSQINPMGEIVCGAIYGAGERKHKEIIDVADENGYTVRRIARSKRRGRKNFDPRMFIDVVDAVNKAHVIDCVVIAAQPADMVHLYSYLRNRGIAIVAADNNEDQASRNLVTEFIDLGKIEIVKAPRPKKIAAPKKEQPAPQPETFAEEIDQTDALLREIDRLRKDVAPKQSITLADQVQHLDNIVNANQPKAEPAKDDLSAQIEELRGEGNNDELLAKIKKLLDSAE